MAMLGEVFRFEWRQQWRAPLFWIVCLVFALLAFAVTSSDAVSIGGGGGNVHDNAPVVIITMLGVMSVIGMFLVTIFVAGAALRDFEQRTSEMVFATGVSRSAYLGGRFAAGYLASLAVMIAVAAGLLLGSAMPWVDPMRLGPTSWAGYAWAFAVIVLPNLAFIAAFLFLLASVSRSMLVTYIGVIALFVLNSVASSLLQNIDARDIAAVLDPFGLEAVGLATRYWSVAESNTQLPPLDGVLLVNRLLWLAVAVAMFTATFFLFRPSAEARSWWRAKKAVKPVQSAPSTATATPIALPTVAPRYGLAAQWRQFLAEVRFDTWSVLRGVPFLVMLAFGLVNLIAILALSGAIYGTNVLPVTHTVLTAMRGSYQWLLFIIIAFYAGELVWRGRSLRVHEVRDAFPAPNWVSLASWLVALITVIFVFQLIGALVGIGFQLFQGFHHIEPLLYFQGLLLGSLPFILLAVMAVVLQVLANSKFLGYLLILLFLAVSITLPLMHYEHNLYDYAGGPGVPYSDMNGFGHFLVGALWFKAYWGFFALGLLVLSVLMQMRGTAQDWKTRKREARARFGTAAKLTLAIAVLGFVGLGGWIFYNTNILNEYHNSEESKALQAEYEKQYAKYADLPQPRITEVRTWVDIFPHQRRVEVKGHYKLVNRHDVPIDSLHVSINPEVKLTELRFAAHEIALSDPQLGYTIYRLDEPLAPGESMSFDFQVLYDPEGFTNGTGGTALVDNGSFLHAAMMMPSFGYYENRELIGKRDRKKFGLDPDKPRMAKLGDQAARANTYISHDADWIDFETTVSTVADQIAIAPGILQREWIEDGRHYFHYKMNQPMLPFYSWLSADYEVARDQWKDVSIEVYYDAKHPYNVDRMIEAVKDSLAYYETNFTPYQFEQIRILEFPGYSSFAQSFANTIPYSESIGFIADLSDPEAIDYVYYVTAHEVAHQWWAHQVIGADMQGSTMLSESLAQYSALMVMEDKYGADDMRKFLKYELDKYLVGRGFETVKELPLAKVENQPYIHYRKGSLVFYALQDYIGEDLLNSVLHEFLVKKRFQMPPYTTSREFMDALSAATGPRWKNLLEDLFWKITLYDNRALSAAARQLPNGDYEVTLKLRAGKTYSDGLGHETPGKIDIPIDVGVFAEAEGDAELGEPLYMAKHRLEDGKSTVTVVVDEKPAEAGIDPYNKLIDRVPGDNTTSIALTGDQPQA